MDYGMLEFAIRDWQRLHVEFRTVCQRNLKLTRYRKWCRTTLSGSVALFWQNPGSFPMKSRLHTEVFDSLVRRVRQSSWLA